MVVMGRGGIMGGGGIMGRGGVMGAWEEGSIDVSMSR